ncbi:MAG: hypothetical protein J0I06_26095 [Planctomycetes bacterium]|nr:hypothetical protein [Planctomycetota bacterium]
MPRFIPILFTLALVGCSSKSNKQDGEGPGKESVLQEVAGLIRSYSGETGRGPKKTTDLAKYETGYPLGYAAVQSGDVVVVWGAKIAGEGDASSAPADVIAYEKKVPTEGGLVLLQNATVKQMTAAEFAAAPRAK